MVCTRSCCTHIPHCAHCTSPAAVSQLGIAGYLAHTLSGTRLFTLRGYILCHPLVASCRSWYSGGHSHGLGLPPPSLQTSRCGLCRAIRYFLGCSTTWAPCVRYTPSSSIHTSAMVQGVPPPSPPTRAPASTTLFRLDSQSFFREPCCACTQIQHMCRPYRWTCDIMRSITPPPPGLSCIVPPCRSCMAQRHVFQLDGVLLTPPGHRH